MVSPVQMFPEIPVNWGVQPTEKNQELLQWDSPDEIDFVLSSNHYPE